MKNLLLPPILATTILAVASGCSREGHGNHSDNFAHPSVAVSASSVGDKEPETFELLQRSEAEWRERLTADQFAILREDGTEPPYSSEWLDNPDTGVYRCAGCDLPLFHTEHKYDSGTGWPSFWAPLHAEHVGTKPDRKLFVTRTEVHCSRCGGHLGHIFDDGPAPTGLRYCINGKALTFKAAP